MSIALVNFICVECDNRVIYDHIKGEHYMDVEGYIVGFKCIKGDDVICDVCYARDSK